MDHMIIQEDQAPAADIWLQEKIIPTCVFNVIFQLVFTLNPQLGEDYMDLQQYIDQFQILDGEPLLSFYLRVLQMMQQIKLQNNNTGQDNRIIRSFVSQLFKVYV